MKSKNENIMQFSTQSNTRGGKITVDSSDSEDNEEQSENDNLKKTVFVDWGKPNSEKRPVISFNALENQTKEEKQNAKNVPETPSPTEADYQSSIKRVSSTNSIHYPQHKTEFYMKDDDDYYNNSNNNYYYSNQRPQYGEYSSHRSHSSRRNQFYDNTEDTNNDSSYNNYRNVNDSYQPAKFAFGQRQQVSQPSPQSQPPQGDHQTSQHSFYKTQPPPHSQSSIPNHFKDAPQIKFFGGKEQPKPQANQQEFRPQPRQQEFRPQPRTQDFKPNQQQKPININFNQQKQPQPNVHTFQPH